MKVDPLSPTYYYDVNQPNNNLQKAAPTPVKESLDVFKARATELVMNNLTEQPKTAKKALAVERVIKVVMNSLINPPKADEMVLMNGVTSQIMKSLTEQPKKEDPRLDIEGECYPAVNILKSWSRESSEVDRKFPF